MTGFLGADAGIPDDVTELTDVKARRVDLVGQPAHGRAFLIAKAAADPPAGTGLRMAVYDANGRLVGTTDPAKVTPVVGYSEYVAAVTGDAADDTDDIDPDDAGEPAGFAKAIAKAAMQARGGQ